MADILVVEARGATQPPQLARRASIQTRCIVQFFLGVVVTGVGVALLWGFLLRQDRAWSLFAVAFVLLGVVVMGANFRTLMRVAVLPEDLKVPITLAYAFAIEGDEVVFPAFVTRPEERWPLRETYAKAGRVLDLVTLTSPGRRARRFFAVSIRIPTLDAAEIVNDHRAALQATAPEPSQPRRPITGPLGRG